MTALKIHPAAELFPMLSNAELQELAADIKKKGLLFPISIYGKTGELLDGRNRLAACEIAGVEPSRYCYPGDDPIGFVLSANIHRRHLTDEQKRDLIARVLMLDPKQSDRKIAKAVKRDHKTVAKVRREQIQLGTIPQLTETTGADGKTRKRPDPKPTKPTAPAAPPKNFVQQEVPIEERRAQMAALADDDQPPAAAAIAEPITEPDDDYVMPPEEWRAKMLAQYEAKHPHVTGALITLLDHAVATKINDIFDVFDFIGPITEEMLPRRNAIMVLRDWLDRLDLELDELEKEIAPPAAPAPKKTKKKGGAA
jgi:hypothetical protein